MENRILEVHHREWTLNYEFLGWQYQIFGTWEFKDYDEVMQEAINSDLAHYNFWEWKVSNDDSNYNFYHEL